MAVNYGWKIKVKKSYRQSKWTYLRCSARKSKLERVPNEEIRRITQAEETVLDRTEARKLRWFGHVMRMPKEIWPAIIHSWIPPRRRDDLDGHGGTASQRQRKKGGWGPDTLEKRVGKAADSRISPPPHTHTYIS
jgi:hypothetical protein